MFAKHVSELTYDDILDLVTERKEEEGYHLDYKSNFTDPNDLKRQLLREVSAFANSGGGYLIFGVTDKQNELLGIDRQINNKDIVEWINQIISANIEPTIFYHDPKVIEIKDSEKVILVLYIPESTKKPHYANESKHPYYIRINDSSKPANHNQIRDMFEFSRNRTEEFNTFLKKRNLYDSDDPNFGLNNKSKRLVSSLEGEKPLVLFSLIPNYPQDEKFNVAIEVFKKWLENNKDGYAPWQNFELYKLYRTFNVKMDGIVLQDTEINGSSFYFEVLNNGFIEAGFSKQVFVLNHTFNNNSQNLLLLSRILGFEMALLGFSKRFYEWIKYYDEVLFQISIVNVECFTLSSFHKNYKNIDWYNTPKNLHHNNIKLSHSFKPVSITECDILEIAKQHSEKICRAFGYEQDYGFLDDEINIERLYGFWNY